MSLAGRPLIPLRLRFRRVGPGVYDSADGRLTLYQIPGCSPAAWNVELTIDYGNALIDLAPEAPAPKETHTLIVDGATTGGCSGWDMEVARAASERWPAARHRIVLPAAPSCVLDARGLYHAGLVDELVEMPASDAKFAVAYRARNERLVDFGNVLVAAVRRLSFYRSGEWMTIGIAQRRGVPVRFVDLRSGALVLADGSSWGFPNERRT